jgi:four helix bundle protein
MRTNHKSTALDLMMDVMPSIKRRVDEIRKHDRNLADHIRRAATSVVLNHAEADGLRRGNQRMRVEIAMGELRETRKGLRLAALWQYVDAREVAQLDVELDRVAAMTWRRMYRR